MIRLSLLPNFVLIYYFKYSNMPIHTSPRAEVTILRVPYMAVSIMIYDLIDYNSLLTT